MMKLRCLFGQHRRFYRYDAIFDKYPNKDSARMESELCVDICVDCNQMFARTVSMTRRAATR